MKGLAEREGDERRSAGRTEGERREAGGVYLPHNLNRRVVAPSYACIDVGVDIS